MFKIADGRIKLYQWDLDRQLIVDDVTVDEVHFSNGTAGNALVCEIFEKDGKRLVNIPNSLLQQARVLTAYAYVTAGNGAYTLRKASFVVDQRPKPDDYAYTETEVKTWAALDERITTLEKSGGAPGTDGYTPVKGKDYYTEADKQEMVNAVIAALPVYNGEVETV